MTFACLGWGSLVWNPASLPCSSEWRTDGPDLPIEFARMSNDGRVTLVLTPGATDVPVLYSSLNVKSLDDAVSALAIREGVPNHDSIGRWPSQKPYPFSNVIESWAQARDVAGVVWTALPPGMKENRGKTPSLDDVIRYLKTLDDQQRAAASEYVRKAPAQIVTDYRASIEQELGIVAAIRVADLADAPADSREPVSNDNSSELPGTFLKRVGNELREGSEDTALAEILIANLLLKAAPENAVDRTLAAITSLADERVNPPQEKTGE